MKRFLPLVATTLVFLPLAAQDQPVRPRIFRIARVELFSSNIKLSNDFYSTVLGTMQPTNCRGGCENLTPSQRFAVNGPQEIALTPMPSPTPANLMSEITFATDDIQALRRYLESRNIAVTLSRKPDMSKPGKMPLMISDPEGHRISFVEWPKSVSEGTSTNSGLPQIIHAGFVVHDRAAEDHFYKDILGFRPYWHGGMKEGQDDWVAMQVPDGTDWLEYMLNIPPDANHHTLGVMNHISLGVPDIHAAEQQLIKNGWKPTEKPKIGRDGKWQLNLYDPDDTRIEFMEFTPAEKPCCSEFTGPHPGPKQ